MKVVKALYWEDYGIKLMCRKPKDIDCYVLEMIFGR